MTNRAILEKISAIEMIDIHLPTTDDKEIVLSLYTQPEKDLVLLLAKIGLTLPAQPPPKISSSRKVMIQTL